MIKWFEKYYVISYIITIIIAIAIFYISSMTFESIGTGTTSINSYIYHFMIFFLFAFFLLISLIKGKYNISLLIIALSIAIIYGISDEIHQLFVPSRYGCIEDVMTNSLGILSAGIIYTIRLKVKK
ncbi:VanZ family protein [Candidatus Pacearchaeota archaeon]|nr:VanZ family protein [Candidatus Pacearchaeota archaeon]